MAFEDIAEAGAQNAPESGGGEGPPVGPVGNLPSVAASALQPAPPQIQPYAGQPPPGAAPVNDLSPLIAQLAQRLQPASPPPPVSPLLASLRSVIPLIAAAYTGARGMGAEGAAQGWQHGIDAQNAQEAATQIAEDRKSQSDLRVAQAIRDLQTENDRQQQVAQTVARQRLQEKNEADRVAREAATEARNKSKDTYDFLNKQAQNPNWVQSITDLANSDPTNLAKLSIQTPWGEAMPLQKAADLGFISQDKDTGKWGVQTKKPPITKTVNDSGVMYSVQLDPQTNQELVRTYLGMQPVKEAKESTAHYQLQPEVDATGKQTGRYLGYNTLTNAWEPVKNPGAGPTATKAAPGAAQEAVRQTTAKNVSTDIGKALTMVDANAPYLGPAAGRLTGHYLLGIVGSTGDPKTDQSLSALRDRIATVKLAYPGAITGSTRAGVGGAVNRLDSVLNSDKMSVSALKGALADMQDAVNERAGQKDITVGKTYIKDATGKWVVQ